LNLSFKLETDRLRIRQFQDSDLESFFNYRNDPEVAKYQGWDVPYPREKALDFVQEMKDKDARTEGDWFQAAIEVIASGEMIGDVAYYLKKYEPQAYIGYSIARRHWRMGYAKEAVWRLLGYLFGELDLHRVVAITVTENLASFQLLERLGFRREGHFIENLMFKGKWGNEYYYGMLRWEWEKLNGRPLK
jgi:RimJ/RimL family protein N-acetyltransferase